MRIGRHPGTLPTFLIIGAQKAGTTSLHYYLGLHPEIFTSFNKESHFFTKDDWQHHVDWYRRQFRTSARVRGESTPEYTNFPRFPDTPERIHSLIPDAKLIYILRDPIDRIVSHWVHSIWQGTEERPFEEAVTDPNRGYVARSRYLMQTERYLRCFPRDRLLLLTQEDLALRRDETLRRTFEFLEVDPGFTSSRFDRLLHISEPKRRKTEAGKRLAETRLMRLTEGLHTSLRWRIEKRVYAPFSTPIARPTVSGELRERLTALLADDVEGLRRFTGMRLEHWSL